MRSTAVYAAAAFHLFFVISPWHAAVALSAALSAAKDSCSQCCQKVLTGIPQLFAKSSPKSSPPFLAKREGAQNVAQEMAAF